MSFQSLWGPQPCVSLSVGFFFTVKVPEMNIWSGFALFSLTVTAVKIRGTRSVGYEKHHQFPYGNERGVKELNDT